jgi:signal recognition particle subunit SRP54
MAFENLTGRLQMALRRITGKAKLTEVDIEEMMREVRLSLLEADVNYQVVRDFTAEVKALALGEKIMKGLDPGQQVVKIVNDELIKLMGNEAVLVNFNQTRATVIMMVGLQGAGKNDNRRKTRSVFAEKPSKKPLFVAATFIVPPPSTS